jgi:hypothetical protein
MAKVFIKNNPNYRVATGGGKVITESDQGGYELLQDKGFKDYIDSVYDKMEWKMQSYKHLEAQRTSQVSESNPATPLKTEQSINHNGKRRSKGKHASCIKLEIDKTPTMVGPGWHARVTLQAKDPQRGFLRETEIPKHVTQHYRPGAVQSYFEEALGSMRPKPPLAMMKKSITEPTPATVLVQSFIKNPNQNEGEETDILENFENWDQGVKKEFLKKKKLINKLYTQLDQKLNSNFGYLKRRQENFYVAGGYGLFGQEHDYKNLGIENPNVRRSGIELVAGSGVHYLESEDFLKRKSPVFSSMDKKKSMNLIKILTNQTSYPDAECSPSKSPEKERSQF